MPSYGLFNKATGQWVAKRPTAFRGKITTIEFTDERRHPYLAMHEAESDLLKMRPEDRERLVIVSDFGTPPLADPVRRICNISDPQDWALYLATKGGQLDQFDQNTVRSNHNRALDALVKKEMLEVVGTEGMSRTYRLTDKAKRWVAARRWKKWEGA